MIKKLLVCIEYRSKLILVGNLYFSGEFLSIYPGFLLSIYIIYIFSLPTNKVQQDVERILKCSQVLLEILQHPQIISFAARLLFSPVRCFACAVVL